MNTAVVYLFKFEWVGQDVVLLEMRRLDLHHPICLHQDQDCIPIYMYSLVCA